MSIGKVLKDKMDHIVVFGAVLLAIGIAFVSGRLSAADSGKLPINIRASAGSEFLEEEGKIDILAANGFNDDNDFSDSAGENAEKPRYGLYAASINSDLYHDWNCPAAERIKDDNKIWFDTEEEALSTGRIKASDCKE